MKNQRRKALLQRAWNMNGLAVNNKWQLRSGRDPDLKKLIKKGYVTMERQPTTGRKSNGKRQSYLVPTLNGLYALTH